MAKKYDLIHVVGALSDKIGRKRMMNIIMICGGIWIMIYVRFQDMTMLYVGMAIALCFFTYPGLITTWFPELYPAKLRGFGFGFTFNLARGLTALAPVTIGALGGQIGLMSAMVVAASVYLAGGLLTFLLPETVIKKSKEQKEQVEVSV
ncbi:MAG: MFS transporter [Clostridiales Family XIII bacterium]|nr:MFS transporter [Clostridiales Family XIII bacterium]